MHTPTVSVGIPIYNAAPYLELAIRSVVNQTFTDWELILLDDGSTDDSLTIAKRWESDRIRVVADGQNQGQTTRLNQLTELSVGHYLARMDADDIMAPERLARQIAYLTANPAVDVAGTFVYTIDTQNRVHGQRGTTHIPTTLAEALRGMPLAHPTVMGRRDWFLQNPYAPSIRRSQDFELWLRTLSHTTFAVIDQPLVFYREIGIPFVKKYRQSTGEFWYVLAQHAPVVGTWGIGRAKAEWSAKGLFYELAGLLGQEDALLKRRSQPLAPEERQQAEWLLAQSIRPATLAAGGF